MRLYFSMAIAVLLFLASCSGDHGRDEREPGKAREATRDSLAHRLFREGNRLYEKNRDQEAIAAFEKSLRLSREVGDSSLQAWNLERMASVRMTDDPAMAFSLYQESLLLFEKIHDSIGMAKVFNVFGFYKTEQGEFDQAEEYFNQAIGINRKSGRRYDLLQNRGNMANLFLSKGDTRGARKIYHEVIDELSQMHDSMSIHIMYYQLASLCRAEGREDSSLLLIDKALQIAEPVHDTELLVSLYGFKGDILLGRGDRKAAGHYLQRSYDMSVAVNDLYTAAEAITFLMRIDSLSGDYRGAYEKSRKLTAHRDSVAARSLRNDVQRAELRYENEKRKSVIEEQRIRLELARREKTQYLVLVLVAIVIIGLTAAVLVLERRNHRRNKSIADQLLTIRNLQVETIRKDNEIRKLQLEKTQEQLHTKQKELVLSALSVDQKNDLLTQIEKRINESLSGKPGTDPLEAVREIINSFRLKQVTREEDELFDRQFASIHEGFHENLKKAHPTLTRSELRFCAYLRLNFTSARIASSLRITPEAIRKTRHRIRKKLNLNPEESLEDYILKF